MKSQPQPRVRKFIFNMNTQFSVYSQDRVAFFFFKHAVLLNVTQCEVHTCPLQFQLWNIGNFHIETFLSVCAKPLVTREASLLQRLSSSVLSMNHRYEVSALLYSFISLLNQSSVFGPTFSDSVHSVSNWYIIEDTVALNFTATFGTADAQYYCAH